MLSQRVSVPTNRSIEPFVSIHASKRRNRMHGMLASVPRRQFDHKYAAWQRQRSRTMAQLYLATAGTPGNADSVNWLLK
jgi:hypothetical protein